MVYSFQYKILNRILFTNAKLFKISLKESEKCSFCNTRKEDLYHLFFNCSYAQEFWKSFIAWWCGLSGESLNLGLKSITVGIVDRVDELNCLIILGKLCIWECRKNKRLPNFRLFQNKIGIKRETERFIAYKNKRLPDFRKRWGLFL